MFEQIKPKISIVVPSWFTPNQHGKYGQNETFKIAQSCLKRLFKVTPTGLCELILIDNGSTLWFDSLEEYWAGANILIRNRENLGFAPAVNQGINLARGEYIIQMNNDILVWDGWLEQMLKDFEVVEKCNPPVGLLMPAIVKEKINFWDAVKMEKKDIDMTRNAGQWGVGAEFGSLWMGKKSLLMEIAKNRDGYQVLDENFRGGFGEDRFLYYEVRKKGLETYRTHNLRVLHVGNVSMTKLINRRDYTIPNREYLRRIVEQDKKGNILTEEDKKNIRYQVNEDFKDNKLT